MRIQPAVIFAIYLASSLIARAGINDGLVAYYPFNGNADDASGNNNHGSTFNLAFGVDGAKFNGSSGVIIPESASLDLPPSVSLLLWIKATNLVSVGNNNSFHLVVFGDTSSWPSNPHENALFAVVNGNSVDFGIDAVDNYPTRIMTAARASSTPSGDLSTRASGIQDGVWAHLAWVYDGTNITTYLNGRALYLNESFASANNLTPYDGYQKMRIGHGMAGGDNRPSFQGNMKEVRLYNRAITASEVQYLYGGEFIIDGIDQNGRITIPNIDTGLYWRVEWSTNPDRMNYWRPDYSPLVDVQGTGSTITIDLPRFFRVVGGRQMLIPDATNVRSGAMVQGVNGTFWQGDRFRSGPQTNTVIDNKTGLMWTLNEAWFRTNWSGAVSFCENLDFGGYDDWRLPTATELSSICGSASGAGDNLDGVLGPINQITDQYWSSTEITSSTVYRVGINLGCAANSEAKVNTDNRLWPVRTHAP